MLEPVTGNSCGKGIQMTTKIRYATASKLVVSPQRPILNGPGSTVPMMRRIARNVIGGMYEMHSAMACNEMIALNAVDEPM